MDARKYFFPPLVIVFLSRSFFIDIKFTSASLYQKQFSFSWTKPDCTGNRGNENDQIKNKKNKYFYEILSILNCQIYETLSGSVSGTHFIKAKGISLIFQSSCLLCRPHKCSWVKLNQYQLYILLPVLKTISVGFPPYNPFPLTDRDSIAIIIANVDTTYSLNIYTQCLEAL